MRGCGDSTLAAVAALPAACKAKGVARHKFCRCFCEIKTSQSRNIHSPGPVRLLALPVVGVAAAAAVVI